jgi:hypothetical protein
MDDENSVLNEDDILQKYILRRKKIKRWKQ